MTNRYRQAMNDVYRHRVLDVPERAAGMRLDRFLAARFPDRSRSSFARSIRDGRVRDCHEQALRASTTLRGGETLHLYIPGIAPTQPPPPLPAVLYEDDRVVALHKPAGMMSHPAGTEFSWAVIGLARDAWPSARMDLVHRLDQYTSGVILLTKDVEANRFLKARLLAGESVKHYLAICRGHPTWDEQSIRAPIGPADGPIRIQMATRPDGLSARTDAVVLGRHSSGLSLLKCRIHTGRTHQIRVHLASVGLPILGDRMYGVPPCVFLDTRAAGAISDSHLSLVGAPRHALHAESMVMPHPSGGELKVEAPMPNDMVSWWEHPEGLPWKPA